MVIKKAIKSPHCPTELHIDKAIALFELKYYDNVYIYYFITHKHIGHAKQDKTPIVR
jgi:hypothetical protein